MAAAIPALTTAAPFITAGTSVLAAAQAGAVGKYNQAIQNRNALVAEQEAERIEKKLEFDLTRFDDQFRRFQSKTTTNILARGVELSGSGLRILYSNAEQAELEKGIMEYNSKVEQAQKIEQANFARMQGSLARMTAKQAQIGYLSQAGTSLLTSGVFDA
jgi:hypothetical protein|tara:strand:- start:5925 stop:6404 length:480 start_codon:yes stop_codon:yes gene_type:complete